MTEKILYWNPRTALSTREKIKQRFNIQGITVNGESRVKLEEKDMKDFLLVVERGYLTPRNKELLHPLERKSQEE